jgi:hypothetical protein
VPQESSLKSVAEIFDIMGGTTSMARVLSIGVSTASEMKRRGRIPAEYWRDIIRASAKRGHPEITADLLAHLHAREIEAGGLAEEGRPFAADHDDGQGNSGQFTRFRHLKRNRFRTLDEINDHIDALRDEWSRR